MRFWDVFIIYNCLKFHFFKPVINVILLEDMSIDVRLGAFKNDKLSAFLRLRSEILRDFKQLKLI
jgi:hypothetical protein